MSDTPIYNELVAEFYERYSKPVTSKPTVTLPLVIFTDKGMAETCEWLDLLKYRPATGGVVNKIYPSNKDVNRTKDDLLIEAQAWRARYQTSSPHIVFQ